MLAAYTIPFNENDLTDVRPLSQHTTEALQPFPTTLVGDATFDT
jgi:hypothetical protein